MSSRHIKLANKPLILVVDNSRAITGALNAMRHATGSLREQFEFEYVVPTGGTTGSILEKDGYTVHDLPFVEISRRKADLLRYGPALVLNSWRLYRLARRRRASIVHLNDFYNLTGYGAQGLSLGKLRIITHVRFLPQSLPQPLARTWRWLGETFASRVVCVSEAVRSYFSASEKIRVVFDPIPSSEAHPLPVEPTWGANTNVRLLYLSNYIPGKGQNFALEAFRRAYAHDQRLRLLFVGGDMGMEKNRAFRQQLEREVKIHGLQEVVNFSGFVSDVEQVIKQADIVLNFSESESFSLTCLDALYYGTSLVASDCGGPAELFENGRSGFLVPNRDVEAMAEAITRLAADPTLRAQFAAQGKTFVRHKFRPEATYCRLGELYKEVLKL